MTADWVPDIGREDRIGLPEAILCEGKSPDQIAAIVADAEGKLDRLLLTRLSPEACAALPGALRAALDYDPASSTAVWGHAPAPRGPANVAILTAGTSDLPVAREAARTLAFHGEPAREVPDVGVAGLWRLTERLDEIRRHPVVIVAAGMDGALFSVVGGLVPGVVIALPTSQGYGIARGGRAALETALASCAPGVAVVNLDNGYGAACLALRILAATRSSKVRTSES